MRTDPAIGANQRIELGHHRSGASISALSGVPELANGVHLALLPLTPDCEFWLNRQESACLSAAAVPRRRREFAAGRACAAAAMAELGLTPMPILADADGLPTWPSGVVGSISHSTRLAAAVATFRSSNIRAIGLDVEVAEPLDDDLIGEVCLPSECEFLEEHPVMDRSLFAKAIFCAKEAAYKCQYSLSRRLFGFQSLAIEIDVNRRKFAAIFQEEVSPFRPGDRLDGRLWMSSGHFFAMSVTG